jgi:hypothetical protein
VDIAIVGWGSLVWSPRELPHDRVWSRGGPRLPLEFSRVSSGGRLTLVIDPCHGEPCRSRFSTSPGVALGPLVEALARRENATPAEVGVVDHTTGATNGRHPRTVEVMAAWSERRRFDAVVWTDLPSNFERRTDRPFTIPHALGYLDALPDAQRRTADEYVTNAPPEVLTPLRRTLVAAADPAR